MLFEEKSDVYVGAQKSVCVMERDFAAVIGQRKRQVFIEAVYLWQDGTTCTQAETFVPYKHLELLQPRLEKSVAEESGDICISISSDCFAPFVWLEVEGEDVVFSDNCFHVTSETPVTVRIRQEDVMSVKRLTVGQAEKKLKIKSLRDTY